MRCGAHTERGGRWDRPYSGEGADEHGDGRRGGQAEDDRADGAPVEVAGQPAAATRAGQRAGEQDGDQRQLVAAEPADDDQGRDGDEVADDEVAGQRGPQGGAVGARYARAIGGPPMPEMVPMNPESTPTPTRLDRVLARCQPATLRRHGERARARRTRRQRVVGRQRGDEQRRRRARPTTWPAMAVLTVGSTPPVPLAPDHQEVQHPAGDDRRARARTDGRGAPAAAPPRGWRRSPPRPAPRTRPRMISAASTASRADTGAP